MPVLVTTTTPRIDPPLRSNAAPPRVVRPHAAPWRWRSPRLGSWRASTRSSVDRWRRPSLPPESIICARSGRFSRPGARNVTAPPSTPKPTCGSIRPTLCVKAGIAVRCGWRERAAIVCCCIECRPPTTVVCRRRAIRLPPNNSRRCGAGSIKARRCHRAASRCGIGR